MQERTSNVQEAGPQYKKQLSTVCTEGISSGKDTCPSDAAAISTHYTHTTQKQMLYTVYLCINMSTLPYMHMLRRPNFLFERCVTLPLSPQKEMTTLITERNTDPALDRLCHLRHVCAYHFCPTELFSRVHCRKCDFFQIKLI